MSKKNKKPKQKKQSTNQKSELCDKDQASELCNKDQASELCNKNEAFELCNKNQTSELASRSDAISEPASTLSMRSQHPGTVSAVYRQIRLPATGSPRIFARPTRGMVGLCLGLTACGFAFVLSPVHTGDKLRALRQTIAGSTGSEEHKSAKKAIVSSAVMGSIATSAVLWLWEASK